MEGNEVKKIYAEICQSIAQDKLYELKHKDIAQKKCIEMQVKHLGEYAYGKQI